MHTAENSTLVEQLGTWAATFSWEDISQEARNALKGRVLDAIGCGIGALTAVPIQAIARLTQDMDGESFVTLIGGGRTAPDRATFFNGAAIRYLDFNDAYLAKAETCHPSDNVAPVLAAAEYAAASGRDFLVALGIAYQVQCRLSDLAPVRSRGFDHTVQGAYGAASIANAVAIAGTSYNSLRVTRTGELSNWKGLASPNTAMGAVHAAMLAKYGINGPREVFEGNKGFMDALSGRFEIDWSKEDLERVTSSVTKRYNAEIHSQSSIEALLELMRDHSLRASAIRRIKLDTFDVAFNIIGGGEEGGKRLVRTKEEADHSLPYLLAVACLDGEVMPEQYVPERIVRRDVQELLRKVDVYPVQAYSDRFPNELACRVEIETTDRGVFHLEKRDYQGFRTRPASWEQLKAKYSRLTRDIDGGLREQIADVIEHLEDAKITDLANLLGQIKPEVGVTS